MSAADRHSIAARIVALSGMGAPALSKHLGIVVATLDRLVSLDASEATYRRILPRLEKLETELAAYKAGHRNAAEEGPTTAALFAETVRRVLDPT